MIRLGAALLVLSLLIFSYSRLAEWQHTREVAAIAPPLEALPDHFALPTPESTRTAR